MSYNKGGLRYPTHIFEAALWGYTVKVECSRCPNVAVFEPQSLWNHFHRKGWEDSRRSAGQRFWCLQCHLQMRGKVRPKRVTFVHDIATRQIGDKPGEYEVKRALSRYRA